MNPPWTDFITDFLDLTAGAFSPDIFRRWSAISAIAGALERRVWLKMGSRVTFPNLFVLLVADPGVGKLTIDVVKELWEETCEAGTEFRVFSVASDNMTSASMPDELGKAKNRGLRANCPVNMEYHSLLIAAEEFGVMLPSYDLAYIGKLNKIYNNPGSYSESRRTGTVKELKISNPQINLLAGVQPGWLATSFPEEAWSTGLTSRLIMVYAAEGPVKDLFADEEVPDELRQNVLHKLGLVSQLYGQCKWEPAAAQLVGDWHLGGGQPRPQHSKLAHYNRRRTSLHMPKLALVSAVARTGRLVIETIDVERAKAWLLEAEALMPDIFRAMVGKSDGQVIEELHYFVTQAWSRDKSKLVHERLMWGFLQQRVPSDKIQRILEAAERSHVIQREAGSQYYKPLPKFEHGVE